MAILSFRFVLVAFLARFLKIEVKRALLSLFLEVLGGGSKEADNKEADNKVVDGKVAYSKDIGSKKVYRFLVDFTLYIFWLSTKSYKKYFSIYFLKLY